MPHVPRPFRRVPPLVRQFVKVAHALTKLKRSSYWVSVSDVVLAMGNGTSTEIDEAIAFAVENDLLRTEGLPSFSVRLTAEGVKLASGP